MMVLCCSGVTCIFLFLRILYVGVEQLWLCAVLLTWLMHEGAICISGCSWLLLERLASRSRLSYQRCFNRCHRKTKAQSTPLICLLTLTVFLTSLPYLPGLMRKSSHTCQAIYDISSKPLHVQIAHAGRKYMNATGMKKKKRL